MGGCGCVCVYMFACMCACCVHVYSLFGFVCECCTYFWLSANTFLSMGLPLKVDELTLRVGVLNIWVLCTQLMLMDTLMLILSHIEFL